MSGSPLRVLIVAETALPYVSGVTVATDALARGLGAAGHRVMLLAPRPPHGTPPADAGTSGPPPEMAWLPSLQLPPPAPPAYRIPVPVAGQRAMRAARAFAPDIVHVQSPFGAGLRGRRLARRAAVPLVFTHHTRFDDYAHYLGRLAHPGAVTLDRWLAAFWASCDAVIAPGEDLGAEIVAQMPAHARTVVRVIPTGVDVAAIRALAPFDIRAAAGWPVEAVVAVTLGRLAPEKSVDDVLDAVACVGELRLAVVGGGPSANALRARAGHDDLRGRVWFAGSLPRPDALAIVRGADLFVTASRTETQGLVVAEALAAGVPVAGLDAPGTRDAVRSGLDGHLAAPEPRSGRAERLAAAIEQVAAHRARLAAATSAGAERRALPVRAAEVADLYRELISRRRPGRGA